MCWLLLLRICLGPNHSIQVYVNNYTAHCITDIDECATGLHNCEHICAYNTEGGFICTCNDGYVLSEDGHTCEGK